MIIAEEKHLAPLHVGIDISKKFFVVCLMEADGKVFGTFEISPTKKGFEILNKSIPEIGSLVKTD